MSNAGWVRLGQRIKAERSRRYPTRVAFARACGLGDRVLAAVENAERTNFAPTTIEAIEAALGWHYGSAARVMSGMEPDRIEDPRLAELRDLWPRLTAEAQDLLVDLARRSAAR